MQIGIIVLIVMNIVGLAIVAVDKSKAKNHKWRIAEKTLFSIAIFGGSLGILLGMYICRHKTKRLKFVLGVPGIIVLQALALVWLKSYIG